MQRCNKRLTSYKIDLIVIIQTNIYYKNINNNVAKITCYGKNCYKALSKEWDEYGFSYIRLRSFSIDDYDKYEKNMVCTHENTTIL